GGGPGTIVIWGLGKPKQLKRWKAHAKTLNDLAFTPDGRYLASCSGDGLVKLWETGQWTAEGQWPFGSDNPFSLAISPDGKLLAVGCWNGEVAIRNISKDARQWVLNRDFVLASVTVRGHDLPVASVAFRGDGKMLASGSVDTKIKIWIDL